MLQHLVACEWRRSIFVRESLKFFSSFLFLQATCLRKEEVKEIEGRKGNIEEERRERRKRQRERRRIYFVYNIYPSSIDI
jgi:hypothetical protein